MVAAVFGAFLNVYRKRVADLFRIATNGTGVLGPGNIHPDLVERLSMEASRIAKHFLSIIIRALDYCPPAHTTFGDMLRSMITADLDLVPNDTMGYRVALIESFKRWGIYPEEIRTMSEDSLLYPTLTSVEWIDILNDEYPNHNRRIEFDKITTFFRKFFIDVSDNISRYEIFNRTAVYIDDLQKFIRESPIFRQGLEQITGLILTNKNCDSEFINIPLGVKLREKYEASILLENEYPNFQVNSIHRSQRVGPDNIILNQVIFTITQEYSVNKVSQASALKSIINLQGGCSIVIDIDKLTLKVIKKSMLDTERIGKFIEMAENFNLTSSNSPFWSPVPMHTDEEPFAVLHEER